MKFNLVQNDGFQNITVFHNGELLSADSNHPNFTSILNGVLADDESVVELFDVSKVVAKKFESLSERVSVANGRVYFDGDEVNSDLTRQIVRFLEEDDNQWSALVNFWENLASNPNEHSREQLYRWLRDRDFAITFAGNLIAYKGVQNNGDGSYLSVNSGSAIVDGVKVTGQIPNRIGSIIEMPRSEVQHDPSIGCHTGLHAGTWDYASDFAPANGAVLKVSINPRDVVSVPTDCYDSKLRVSRYTVLDVLDAPVKTVVDTIGSSWDDDYDKDDEYDSWYDTEYDYSDDDYSDRW